MTDIPTPQAAVAAIAEAGIKLRADLHAAVDALDPMTTQAALVATTPNGLTGTAAGALRDDIRLVGALAFYQSVILERFREGTTQEPAAPTPLRPCAAP